MRIASTVSGWTMIPKWFESISLARADGVA
jgi:hypothetical protein